MKILKLKNLENQPLHTKTVLKLIGNSLFTQINFKNAIKTVFFQTVCLNCKKSVSILKKGVEMIIKGYWHTKGNLYAF